jgi:hypothetical protein
MNETRKMLRFDKQETKIITETMKRYSMTYNGAVGFIIRNWKEMTNGLAISVQQSANAKEAQALPRGK